MGDIPEQDEAAMAILEPPSCLTLRCFYLRLSRCEVDESLLDTLTITYIPLSPDTVLEVSGGGDQKPPSITHVDKRSVSFPLRRDRVDAASEEATFVSTTTIRILAGGSVRFEVQNGDERLMVGILETCDVESLLLGGGAGKAGNKKSRSRGRTWVMKCQVATQRGSGFLRCGAAAKAPPAVEVYVVGVFRGTPIVFTKAMQLRFRRRRPVKAFMDPIPECAEQAEDAKETAQEEREPEESEYRCYKPDLEADGDDSLYMGSPAAGRDDDDECSELSWFTAGVRVGVGIGVGICLGVGLLARTYQSTSKNVTRRLISKLL